MNVVASSYATRSMIEADHGVRVARKQQTDNKRRRERLRKGSVSKWLV
jgi:hypothetical protein